MVGRWCTTCPALQRMVGWWCTTCPGLDAITWERLTCRLISIIIQRNKSTEAIAAAATASHVISSNHHQLPDDIISGILSRLPSHQLMELRYVCKRWFALTSTQSFREVHYKNQPPMHLFVIQYHPYATNQTSPSETNYFELLAISENHRLERGTINIALWEMMKSQFPKKYYMPFLISSYKGLLLFIHDSTEELVSIFYNPTTGEQVNVNVPSSRYLYCGFYFHSSSKEYRVLYGVLDDDHEQDVAACIGFAILGLRTRSLRRIGNFSHCPSSLNPPIILNGALHWTVYESTRTTHGHTSCSESILSFGTESEEFHLMPHPGDECSVGGEGHVSHDAKMCLGDIDGQLCLCVSSDSSESLTSDHKLDIWVLEDYKEWIWAKRHVVMLGQLAIWQGPLPSDNEHGPTVQALSIHDGELLMIRELYSHSYFIYNLKKGSLRKLETTNLAYGNMVVVHPSLVSLHTNKKFGYVLSLHDDDQVAEWDLDYKTCREQHNRIGQLLQMLFRRKKKQNLLN